MSRKIGSFSSIIVTCENGQQSNDDEAIHASENLPASAEITFYRCSFARLGIRKNLVLAKRGVDPVQGVASWAKIGVGQGI